MRTQERDQPGRRYPARDRYRMVVMAMLILLGGLFGLQLVKSLRHEPETDAIEIQLRPAPEEGAKSAQQTPVIQPAPVDYSPEEMTGDAIREPLPSLNESDELVRETLLKSLGSASAWLPEDDILRRQAVLLSALQTGAVLRKPIEFPAPEGKFRIEQRGDRVILSTSNFRRYQALISLMEAVNVNAVAGWFRRFEPLLEEAWLELGNDRRTLQKAIADALELAIATPDIDAELDLVRPGVMYKYADPALEALPDIQKLLLRAGPDNRARIKTRCRELLEVLLQ